MPIMSIAKNLPRLRKDKGLSQVALAKKAGVSQQLISRLESGVDLTSKKLPELARAIGVHISEIDENYHAIGGTQESQTVPVLSTVSAGAMMRDDLMDEAKRYFTVTDLGPGDWFALEVEGDSMDRISPPGSIIFINRKDKRLVPNGCYVIANQHGEATYKRYRPNPDRFEPVSTNPNHEPIFPDNDAPVIGRVKRSMIDM